MQDPNTVQRFDVFGEIPGHIGISFYLGNVFRGDLCVNLCFPPRSGVRLELCCRFFLVSISTKDIFFDLIRARQTSFEDLGYFRLQACDISLGIIYRMSVRPRRNIPVSIHHDLLAGIDHRLRNSRDSKCLAD